MKEKSNEIYVLGQRFLIDRYIIFILICFEFQFKKFVKRSFYDIVLYYKVNLYYFVQNKLLKIFNI